MFEKAPFVESWRVVWVKESLDLSEGVCVALDHLKGRESRGSHSAPALQDGPLRCPEIRNAFRPQVVLEGGRGHEASNAHVHLECPGCPASLCAYKQRHNLTINAKIISKHLASALCSV